MASLQPGVGRRIRIGGDYGTVLFVGEVAGTPGQWLGVEWDNGAKRGKHSGEKNGIKYFTCRTPGSGSFLRPNAPGLITGVGFDAALLGKYIDDLRTNGEESVILGSSNGAIIVEAPRLNKIRGKFSQIERLKRISLNNQDVSTPGDPDTISKLCRSVQSLDLSQTLVGDWNDVVDIIRNVSALTHLELNYNRLQLTCPLATSDLPRLTHLRLNSTTMTWAEACEVLVHFPFLLDLQLGYNGLKELTPSSKVDARTALPSLKALNLDSNVLNDWISIMHTCSSVSQLESLMIPSNAISSIPTRSSTTPPLLLIRILSISDNLIAKWSDIDALVTWCPELQELGISFEPLILSGPSGAFSREFIIARLSQLKRLNGTEVTVRERSDAELFYLSWISKHETGSEQDIESLHPRWKELKSKYQTSQEVSKPTVQNLGSHMIMVNVVRVSSPVSKGQVVRLATPSTPIRVLPNMVFKTFGMKLKKLLKLQKPVDTQALWILSSPNLDEATVLRPFDSDPLRDLSWSGVEEGCFIGLVDE